MMREAPSAMGIRELPRASAGAASRVRRSRAAAEFGSRCSVVLALGCLSCEPSLVVGSYTCDETRALEENAAPEEVTLPWHTGFEDGFCGYADGGGFCYANPEASYDLASAPVHSGNQAAAFHVTGNLDPDGLQARCARTGILPEAAYYGAWFYVPSEVTSTDNWNLFHFDGNGADVHHDLWDVSLRADADGSLHAYVFDFLRMTVHDAETSSEVPVAEWFHLEVHWQRATDPTGTFELYVDGTRVISLTDLITDDAESGEWYVGNLATELTPNPNTLYVDDVGISATRQGGN